MTMEKRAIIEEGRTPPEKPQQGQVKQGSDRQKLDDRVPSEALADHVTKRLIEAADTKKS